MPCGPSEPHSAREPHPRSALKRCPSAPPESLCAVTTVAPQAPADGDRLPWTGLSDNHQQQHVHACPECLLLTGHREGGDRRGTTPGGHGSPCVGHASRPPAHPSSSSPRRGGRGAASLVQPPAPLLSPPVRTRARPEGSGGPERGEDRAGLGSEDPTHPTHLPVPRAVSPARHTQ